MSSHAIGLPSKSVLATVISLITVLLAGLAVRTPLAAAFPLAASLLFLWVVADSMMLGMMARTEGLPSRRAVVAVLAAASITVSLGAPTAIRETLWSMPLLALAMTALVSAHIGCGALRMRRALKTPEKTTKERWFAALSSVLPPMLIRLAIAELTILHMALLRWGGPADVPAHARAFSYHKHLTPMCSALLVLSGIEIMVYHLLIGHWSRVGAIVLFVLSDVGFIYMIGIIKSFRYRPVLFTPDGVQLRTGLLIDRFIPFDSIAAVETGFSGERVRDPGTLNAALMAWPNIILRLNVPLEHRSILRKRAPTTSVAFRLDEPGPFLRLLHWRLGHPLR
ncbi:hypothetical protein [Novosphingopyxis baekryungensis]|uniref:hypothetical protein n=1 Tax=Novosphingopyxis baekryungensis TaxID=279369 RepID=UPI0003B6F180|nr:hypothetical protein [Novosphingopyxis baekryungensis]